MKSHLLQMMLYSTLVSTFFAVLMRRTRQGQIRLGAILWLAMVGGALAMAYLMFPFPG
jgi:hypothetical protein